MGGADWSGEVLFRTDHALLQPRYLFEMREGFAGAGKRRECAVFVHDMPQRIGDSGSNGCA